MLEERSIVKEGGRVVIPASIRHQMHMHIGDELIFRLQGDELRVCTLRQAVLSAQDVVQQYNTTGKRLSDAVIHIRREEESA